MGKKPDVLDRFYKEAKRKRIVLNKDEFAKMIGFSRVHLYRLVAANDPEIIKELIGKAKEISNKVVENNYNKETNDTTIVSDYKEKYLTALELIRELQTQLLNKQKNENESHQNLKRAK